MTIISCPPSPSVEGVRIITAAAPRTSKIVDLALEIIGQQVDEDDEGECDDAGLLPSLPSLATTSSRPPLQELSVSSSCCSSVDEDDDDDSVSLISAISGDEETSQSRRSIFNRYWEKNGGAPARLDPVPTSVVVVAPQHQEAEGGRPEASPKKLNCKSCEEGPNSSRRRKIFGGSSWSRSSEPVLSLSYLAHPSMCLSKAHSTSSLQPTPPRGSCLRRGKFSSERDVVRGEQQQSNDNSAAPSDSSESSSSSVTFSQDVSVHVFQKSTERWAQEGWSKWFA